MRNVMAIDNGKIIGIPSAASGVSYDNTDSGLSSTNVQDAIDEVSDDLSDKVDKVTGKGLSSNDYTNADKAIVDGVTSALAGKANVGDIPTKTSDLINDSGFITNLVNNLLNYYLKSETYSKAEVDALLQAITTLDIQAVSQLPTTNISTTTIYLVPKQDPQVPDVKDEYINLDGTTSGWELIGNTQIDLSNYVTTSDLTTALADYVTSEQFSKEFFIGTQAVWNSLTVSQKTEYTFAVITDDYDENPVGNLNALTTTDKSSCVGAINEVKSGLTDVANEIEDFRKRYNGGDLWPGDTLTFNNVRASSNFVYRFMAFDTTAAVTPESAYLIVKSNAVQVYGKVGTFTTAYDAEHEILSITLPSSSYWDYRFEVAARRNG